MTIDSVATVAHETAWMHGLSVGVVLGMILGIMVGLVLADVFRGRARTPSAAVPFTPQLLRHDAWARRN